jgi:hypothetical protein
VEECLEVEGEVSVRVVEMGLWSTMEEEDVEWMTKLKSIMSMVTIVVP